MRATAEVTSCRGATLGEILSILGVVAMLFLLGAAGCSFLVQGSSVGTEQSNATAPAASGE